MRLIACGDPPPLPKLAAVGAAIGRVRDESSVHPARPVATMRMAPTDRRRRQRLEEEGCCFINVLVRRSDDGCCIARSCYRAAHAQIRTLPRRAGAPEA